MPRHGGDIYSFQKQEKPLLDFSANINPLGVPDVLRSAIVNVVDFLVHYPDPAQTAAGSGRISRQNPGTDRLRKRRRRCDLPHGSCCVAEPRTDSRAGIFGICGGAC